MKKKQVKLLILELIAIIIKVFKEKDKIVNLRSRIWMDINNAGC